MESKWGLVPDMSASVTLRELVPIDVAKELTMTHRIFKGQEAKDLGIVTRVCDDAMADALALAKEIASKSPDAVAAAKRLYNNTYALNDRQVSLSLSLSLYIHTLSLAYIYTLSLYIYTRTLSLDTLNICSLSLSLRLLSSVFVKSEGVLACVRMCVKREKV